MIKVTNPAIQVLERTRFSKIASRYQCAFISKDGLHLSGWARLEFSLNQQLPLFFSISKGQWERTLRADIQGCFNQLIHLPPGTEPIYFAIHLSRPLRTELTLSPITLNFLTQGSYRSRIEDFVHILFERSPKKFASKCVRFLHSLHPQAIYRLLKNIYSGNLKNHIIHHLFQYWNDPFRTWFEDTQKFSMIEAESVPGYNPNETAFQLITFPDWTWSERQSRNLRYFFSGLVAQYESQWACLFLVPEDSTEYLSEAQKLHYLDDRFRFRIVDKTEKFNDLRQLPQFSKSAPWYFFSSANESLHPSSLLQLRLNMTRNSSHDQRGSAEPGAHMQPIEFATFDTAKHNDQFALFDYRIRPPTSHDVIAATLPNVPFIIHRSTIPLEKADMESIESKTPIKVFVNEPEKIFAEIFSDRIIEDKTISCLHSPLLTSFDLELDHKINRRDEENFRDVYGMPCPKAFDSVNINEKTLLRFQQKFDTYRPETQRVNSSETKKVHHFEKTKNGLLKYDLAGYFGPTSEHHKTSKTISVVIPTKDLSAIFKPFLSDLFEKTEWPTNFEVVVIDNNSTEKETFSMFDEFKSKYANFRVVSYPKPYNYSAINNFAVEHTKGEILLFLNNDMRVRNSQWVRQLYTQILRPKVGAVGALLYYDNEDYQHLGVTLGLGGIAGHTHRGRPKSWVDETYHRWIVHETSAVTAACLMTKSELFKDVKGFDAEALPINFSDIDYCLKLRQNGHRIILNPYAELYHLESLSRPKVTDPAQIERFRLEIDNMKSLWGSLLEHDPFYHPYYGLTDGGYEPTYPPRFTKKDLI